MSDFRFALRQFLQKPGFTATAVLVLALGIGANVAVFSLVTAFNFAPLPVRDPDQLVAVALGALRRQVLLLMLRRGLVLAAIGTLVGGVAALGTSQLLRSLLHGVSTTDPVTFAGVCVVMMVTSTLACWLPGRRAMKIEPMEARRNE